jgi:uncharacterized BrkB/YihY/UPF0761 family membrane protein
MGVKRRISGAAEWAKSERVRAEALRTRRQSSAIIDAGFEIQELDIHVGGGILAGAVAFRMFLFLVPFVYIVFTVFDAVARAAGDDPSQAAKTVGITGVLASAVVNSSDIGAWSQFFLVVGATGALVLTARSLIKTLYVAHWLVWRIPRSKPRGFAPVLVTVGIGLALTAFAVIADAVRRWSGPAGLFVTLVIITSAAFLLWWWVSWHLPHAATTSRSLIPGAVFMAVGVEVLHILTTYWLGHLVARKSRTYGAVGIALAVLLWVYLLGRVVVASAGINATLWRRREKQLNSP